MCRMVMSERVIGRVPVRDDVMMTVRPDGIMNVLRRRNWRKGKHERCRK